MCKLYGSNGNGFGDIWWTDNPTYFSSIDRSQYVSRNDKMSERMKITCGVPQGSILSHALFILYINDMCNVSSLMKSIVFADDTNFFTQEITCRKFAKLYQPSLANYMVSSQYAFSKYL